MIWYPYEQMKTMKPPYKIVDAEGVYLYTEDNKMIDSISSWWSTIHGYKHPVITQAIKDQADKFSHVMLGGLTHDPALELSAKLAEWLPGDLDYCFFSDSGSVGVEVALKMALQYYVNQGDMERTKVLALQNAYHGDTFKAMEVGDDEDYHFILEAYGEKKYVINIPTEISALEEAFPKHHRELNCMIVEPLLQGAAGMLMYDISFLQRARELCDEYGVLLIFDEVATGFGRTGHRRGVWRQAYKSSGGVSRRADPLPPHCRRLSFRFSARRVPGGALPLVGGRRRGAAPLSGGDCCERRRADHGATSPRCRHPRHTVPSRIGADTRRRRNHHQLPESLKK